MEVVEIPNMRPEKTKDRRIAGKNWNRWTISRTLKEDQSFIPDGTLAIDYIRERMNAGPHRVARANHCSVRQCLHFFQPIITAWVYRGHTGSQAAG